ncbi:Phosphohydrolase [Tenacibaculum maritimum]|uniref:Phosphohydrolase n=1 Tax=Tenacibaculum maritimum NCIMB 2154 TaxID=1349785 RepID=A0A2H1E9M5_9FLAO|nr:Phosphohydrolase [Tenacibaculum maritimum]CAA0154402.1 Phosphohydrolase [Tenacibaculum maritimum]CAA0154444.1 Phosphohydrolase [Tenacibaculum maritimum]CAA0213666.1 Phosphohydrolase [Tenacibaculum maritimum]SFZ82228.1 Phosphohydrolase [Tenacibaculum maritimum NCIMB 2154]
MFLLVLWSNYNFFVRSCYKATTLKKIKTNKLKILNDPIYGFISIPNSLIFDIIEHRYFQRLRRVSQMGLSNLVYPGANHTRFHHALGCMHLMQKAVAVLRNKNVVISDEEANALYLAILLHDIGHGAFSHALEHSIVNEISHEEISLKFMKKLNKEFEGKLSLAIEVFEGKYHRPFLCQLISSQLDIDRLDYLKRDSFYTGVAEGNISSDRLIAMMNVKEEQLVIEQKGIYSVEKFIIARRLMYWQVYLHKTGLVAENMLVMVLKRAKELAKEKVVLCGSKAFRYFLYNEISEDNFTEETLEVFSKLDDYDILAAIKEWENHSDEVLSKLSKMLIYRNLLKIKIQDKPFDKTYVKDVMKKNKIVGVSDKDLHYFLFAKEVSNQAYDKKKPIRILGKEGSMTAITNVSDQLSLQALTKPVVKYYFCYTKDMILD